MKRIVFTSGLKKMMEMLVLFLVSVAFTGCGTDVIPEPNGLHTQNSQSAKPKHPGYKHFTADLDGGQEVPPNASVATGFADFKLKPDGLHFSLSVDNIENITQAHIHLAPAGENGSVVVWLYPSGPPAQLIPGNFSGKLATGVITDASLVGPLAGQTLDDLLDHLVSGGAYVNVHTQQFPGGEIRGQIYPKKAKPVATNFVAPLSGRQEVPANKSKATGNAIFKLKEDGLHYKLIVANIQNVTQAHIHLAPAGENGSVVAWLYPSGPPAQLIPGRSNGILATGVITDASLVGPLAGQTLDDLLDHLVSGGAYVNVHTSQFPGGEIRGQIK